jgi:hypothetical protein
MSTPFAQWDLVPAKSKTTDPAAKLACLLVRGNILEACLSGLVHAEARRLRDIANPHTNVEMDSG